MRAATHEAAIAFLDDLNFVSRTLSYPQPTAGDVRRLSVIIRRFLFDGHLNAVAAPRIGRVRVMAPNFESLLADTTSDFITVGFPPLFGTRQGIFECYRIAELDVMKDGNASLFMANGLQQFREVSIHGLLSDTVVRLRGDLISRSDFLKFVCYHDFGVHYSGREEIVFDLIRTVRHFLCFLMSEDGAINVSVSDAFNAKKPENMLLDLAHAHTLATGYYLVVSPDLSRLGDLIEAEIASAKPATKDRPH